MNDKTVSLPPSDSRERDASADHVEAVLLAALTLLTNVTIQLGPCVDQPSAPVTRIRELLRVEIEALLSEHRSGEHVSGVSSEMQRKINVLDASAYILNGLRAVVAGVLEKQRQAKERSGNEWCDGYAAAMQDAIKSIASFIEEIDGTPIAPSPALPVSEEETFPHNPEA